MVQSTMVQPSNGQTSKDNGTKYNGTIVQSTEDNGTKYNSITY